MLEDLLAFFASDPSANVRQVSRDELEVSLLGSYSENAMRMELYLRLRAWEAGAPSGDLVEIVG